LAGHRLSAHRRAEVGSTLRKETPRRGREGFGTAADNLLPLPLFAAVEGLRELE
jgi:hypothetical protein